MAFDIDNWLSTFSNEDVVFAFEGELSEEKLTEILDVVEQKLDSTDAPRKIKKKAYNIAIESIQNLFHHSDTVFLNGRQKKTLRYSVVLIIKVDDENFKIITGNFVDEKKRLFLQSHIDKINSLDKENLKKLYKEILDNQSFSEKGGGGLGMVDIARKAGNKIKICFHSYKNSLSFFDFSITINQ